MKIGLYLMLSAIILISCEKGGTINYTVKYTTSDISLKSVETSDPGYYTGLGDYITSITPFHFSAKMNVMMYQDHWQQSGPSTHMISYIDGHDNDPNFEISLYVDFSNNEEVIYKPILYSTDIRNGIFGQKQVVFNYFYFVPYHFTQKFVIPEPYGEQNILGENGSYSVDEITGKRVITVNQQPLLQFVFGNADREPFGYFFGNTDSTWIVNRECALLPQSEDYPNGGNRPIVRSHMYLPVTVDMPADGESIEMYSTISFDTKNLIQVYTGPDKLPYTPDDIFVYAPNYWERIKVRLEII